MIKFNGNIVQFGFGAVGKSFYEKVRYEIKFNDENYYVISANKEEYEYFISLGGLSDNFYVSEITNLNYIDKFGKFLKEGDLLIDFADTVGTRDICRWCAENNIMYINTGEADWPSNWYSIFNENLLKRELKKEYNGKCKYPIVLQHGNNPGLVSHFTKLGIKYIVRNQFKKDRELNKLLKENKFNEIAYKLGIRMIHVNDIDLQEIDEDYMKDKLLNTWCIDSFFFEILSESTQNVGTHEVINKNKDINYYDKDLGFLEYRNIAIDTKCKTYCPNGYFEGHLVPHEETITIASNLEVVENDKVLYRPSVMFLYLPCVRAQEYMNGCKVNDYPDVDKLGILDCDNVNNVSIIRGRRYPDTYEIVYREKIVDGTEYVGVFILGDNFKPVWVGNRIELSYLYKKNKSSDWQTPTITPVAMSALSAVCWMINNKNSGGIYFPDDINDYENIVKLAEKYISKTIYETYDKELISDNLNIDFNNIQSKDFFLKTK